MNKVETIDVTMVAKGVARDVTAIDLAAGFPVGAIILALALKEYYGPEVLSGEGRVRIDGEEIDVLNERIVERLLADREEFHAWLKENPEALTAEEWPVN